MTATARIAKKTAADKTYTGTVAAGSIKTFSCQGLKNAERVVFEHPDESGNYGIIRSLDGEGKMQEAFLGANRTVMQLTGPIDFRINKPVTEKAVSVVEHT